MTITTDAKPTVAFLGLGIMGQAMAANLLKSGHFAKVIVWNRSADKCDALVADGAVAAATPAEAVAGSDIAFGMLADPKAALDVSVCLRGGGGGGGGGGFRLAVVVCDCV